MATDKRKRQQEASRRFRARHLDDERERNREYARQTRTLRKAAGQVVTEAEREKQCEYQRCYRKKHPERVKAAWAKFRAKLGTKEHYTQLRKEWRARKPEEHHRNVYMLRTYGLTLVEYAALLTAQGGRCANPGCRAEEPSGRGKHFHVDHDHETKKVRGLLCNRCNVALGMVRDDAEKLTGLVMYLRQHQKAEESAMDTVQ